MSPPASGLGEGLKPLRVKKKKKVTNYHKGPWTKKDTLAQLKQ